MPQIWPQRMRNPIRDYAWGSATMLAQLQGRSRTGEPEAELWLGAHPSDPSHLIDERGLVQPLDALIAAQPKAILGEDVQARFGDRLPFLLKLLAIGAPLSLQVHPSAERALAAFTGREPALGGHHYVDAWPKPELVYALQPLDVLCGFRSAEETDRLLTLLELGAPQGHPFTTLRTALKPPDGGHPLVELLRRLVTWPVADRPELVRQVAAGCAQLLQGPDARSAADAAALRWAMRLCEHFPADPLVTAPLLLELVQLAVGEVVYVPAGSPHAYLSGFGVEIMANSDNVVRAGLTPKAVAVEELMHIIDGDSRPVREVPLVRLGDCEQAWLSPATQFRLGRIDLTAMAGSQRLSPIESPRILLCVDGEVDVVVDAGPAVRIGPGESVFVAAPNAGAGMDVVLTLSTGRSAQVFSAAVGTQALEPFDTDRD